jgi:cyclopropane-fatty-acyl-phospholipid synthase
MNKIINILREQKSMPIDRFIDVALYDKKFGYYMKKNPFGKKGDYITSPLISNLFGEMIAIWCVAFWEHIGKPKKILITELGPGDASLCKNLLSTFKNFKSFYKCIEIKLIEKSNKLKRIQKARIKNKKVKWVKKIDDLNYGPIIFLGNEFFDSLPIKQIHKKENLFLEKHITLSKNNKKIDFLFKKAKKNLIKNIKKLDLVNKSNTIEYPIAAIKYLKIIAKKIKKYDGALLTIDYGYIEKKNQDTLQSAKKHKYLNVFKEPGSADITHHINYKLFSKILKRNKLEVEKIVSQNEFLQKLGIIERANMLSKKINFRAKANIYYRLKKLLHYREMGDLFKVLLAQKKGTKFSLGFR